jgi:spore coat protein H
MSSVRNRFLFRLGVRACLFAASSVGCSGAGDTASLGEEGDAGPGSEDAGTASTLPDEPDYEKAFPQDQVRRLDLVMSAASFQRIQDDMTSMLGAFGSRGNGTSIPGGGAPGGGAPGGGGFPAGMNGGFTPPEELFAACASLTAGAACEAAIVGMALAGTCTADQSGRLMCQPSGIPGGGMAAGGSAAGGMGGFAQGGVDLVPNTPAYAECEVRVDGQSWQYVGFRYKGNSSLASAWQQGIGKLPFRLKFDEFEDVYPEIRNQRYFGFQLLSFSNGWSDPSLLRAKLGAEFFERAGLPTPRSAFYSVFLDHGDGPVYLGLYTAGEVPADDAFLERAFGSDDGNLYKPDGVGARWETYDETSLEKENHESEADFSDTEALYAALHAERTDSAYWRAGLDERLNTDLFLNWLAVNTVIQDWDQYGRMPHNYYLYADPNDAGRFAWIPWDHSLSLQDGGPSLSLSEVTAQWPLIRYLLDDDVYRQVYRDYVAEMVRGAFAPDVAAERFRAAQELIAPYVIGADGEQPGYTFLSSPEEFNEAVEQLVTHAQTRARAVSEFLAAP